MSTHVINFTHTIKSLFYSRNRQDVKTVEPSCYIAHGELSEVETSCNIGHIVTKQVAFLHGEFTM